MISHAGCGRKEMRRSRVFLFMGWREGNGEPSHLLCWQWTGVREHLRHWRHNGQLLIVHLSSHLAVNNNMLKGWSCETFRHDRSLSRCHTSKNMEEREEQLNKGSLGTDTCGSISLLFRVTRKSNRWQTLRRTLTGDVPYLKMQAQGELGTVKVREDVQDLICQQHHGWTDKHKLGSASSEHLSTGRMEEASWVGGNSHM